ncbi:hypothetical protein CXB51_005080 [Gossypium anomalum]|uniref:Bet v I/Major latex protein domain-containing protein n=1 Tax=Gossypium anomalum TaxID=47600 RepID=A0A8J5ZW25_9ROSI|nr:hypothetical protein CXB51_005080 [Gossypium anomalum]
MKCLPTNRTMCTILAITRFKDAILHEGEWGKVGTIVHWSYMERLKGKGMVEAIDPDKNLVTFRVIEGDLMEEYKNFVITIQVSPKSEGSGSVVHWTLEYEKLHDGIAHPETLLQFVQDVSKDIDEHLTQAS